MDKGCSNVLVTSIGNKVPALKAVRKAMQRAFTDTALLYGADCRQECIGKYFIDRYWRMPELSGLSAEALLSYCEEQKIRYIIPTRDGELSFFAEHRAEFEKKQIVIMVPALETVRICLDKLKFYETLAELGFPVIKTMDNISGPFFERYVVKEKYGAGAVNMGLNLTAEEAVIYAQKLQQPVFQPFIEGHEYSVDVYVSRKGTVMGAVARRRDYVANGEAQITTTEKFPKLEQLSADLVRVLKLEGHAVIQVIVDDRGDFHIVECNCRFGGASTLSIAMGLDSFYWLFIEGMRKSELPIFRRYEGEKRQIRYAEDLIYESNRL